MRMKLTIALSGALGTSWLNWRCQLGLMFMDSEKALRKPEAVG